MEKQLVLVDTVSIFRMRYLVEVPAGRAEYALGPVAMNEATEFSQEHIGENIVSHRVVSEDEALQIFDQDNDYCKDWAREYKLGSVVTPWVDEGENE